MPEKGERTTVRVGVAGLVALPATYGLGRQAYGLFVPWFQAESTLGLAVEIGDGSRLDGRRIGSNLGLLPTETSTGASRTPRSLVNGPVGAGRWR